MPNSWLCLTVTMNDVTMLVVYTIACFITFFFILFYRLYSICVAAYIVCIVLDYSQLINCSMPLCLFLLLDLVNTNDMLCNVMCLNFRTYIKCCLFWLLLLCVYLLMYALLPILIACIGVIWVTLLKKQRMLKSMTLYCINLRCRSLISRVH